VGDREITEGKTDAARKAAPADAAPAGPPMLAVSGVERWFGDPAAGGVPALAGADLAIHPGELLTLLGPSGSGKTTLLKVVAGFEPPDKGKVMLDGRDITALSPAKRNIGMVFQHYALFPHMSAAANIAFPLAMRGLSRDSIRDKVASALALVGLSGYDERLPRQLSGGQQQRVALARAIVFDPVLLLLDEPFGALDRKLRTQMQAEVKSLQRRLGVTTLFVTHDQEEALVLSDRIAVMNHGRIAQVGAAEDLYRRPASRFVAEFVGEANVFRGRAGVISGPAHARIVEVKLESGAAMRATLSPGDRSVHYGADLALVVRPERPRLVAGGGPNGVGENRVAGTVAEANYLGETIRYRVALEGGGELMLRWSAEAPRLAPGTRVELGWSAAETNAVLWA
jgi:putative spermidine/putrescine transport system ATP-binding protein